MGSRLQLILWACPRDSDVCCWPSRYYGGPAGIGNPNIIGFYIGMGSGGVQLASAELRLAV